MSVLLSDHTHMITRAEWGARTPRLVAGINPTFGTTVHWEGPHMGSFSHDACFSYVRGIQNYHMKARNWSDIAYNFLVCPHGIVFEGRGLGRRSGANGTNDGNARAYAGCYLGGQGDPFTPDAQRALRDAVRYFDAHGNAGGGVNCHRDWKATQCPGNEICEWVKGGMGSVGIPAPPAPPNMQTRPILRYGSKGSAVADWQKLVGPFTGGGLKVDADFGLQTQARTKQFQSQYGLVADGIVGLRTWNKMADCLAWIAAQEPAPPPASHPAFPGLMRRGSKGNGVRQLQMRLRDRGWRIAVDGDFGSATEEVVKAFQKDKRLQVDGIVGPQTWNALWTTPVT